MKKLGFLFLAIMLTFGSCNLIRLPDIFVRSQSYTKVGSNPLKFWRAAMTIKKAQQYKAYNYITYCNVFLGDTIKGQMGNTVFKKVFPNGVLAPNVIFEEWKTNKDLVRLTPEKYSLTDIQKLADDGYLVLLAYWYYAGPSHLAVVGHSQLKMFTVPSISNLEKKKISQLGEAWMPVVVQAGTYTGVTSAAYATNGWFGSAVHPYDAGIVRFYLVKS